jgi:nitrate/nitrite transporter NarK
LGGILSDWCNKRWAMQGRLWAHFIALFGQAVFLFLFGCVTSDMGWPLALVVLVLLSTFVNMAEGTSFGIVPYMIPEELAVVSAMVGAGGTLGAVIVTRACFMTTTDDLLPFKLNAGYVLFWALTVFAMRWDHLGSMFHNPKTSRTPSPSQINGDRTQEVEQETQIQEKDKATNAQTLPQDPQKTTDGTEAHVEPEKILI